MARDHVDRVGGRGGVVGGDALVNPRRVWRWAAQHQFVTALVLFSLVVSGAFWRDAHIAAQDRARAACVSDWGDEFTAQVKQIRAAGNARTDALDTVLRDVFDQISTGRNDPAAFRARLAEYIAASDTYTRSQADNPVPDPPRIRC